MKLEGVQEILGSIERGQVSLDFTHEVRAVLTALAAQGKAKGSVTLKLNFAVEQDQVACTPEITSKIPKPKRRSSHFWTEDGDLYTADPRQTVMFPSAQARKPIGQTIDN